MAHPDLQIRGGGGVGWGGGSHLDPEVRCWGRSQKCIFWPFGPQFGLKMGVGVSPGSATVFVQIHIERPLNGLNGQSMDNVWSKVSFA